MRAGLASQLDEDERQDIYTTYGIPQDLFYLTKHELAEKLYAFQVTWLAQRMLGFEEKYCQYKPNESLKVKCQ